MKRFISIYSSAKTFFGRAKLFVQFGRGGIMRNISVKLF